MSAGIAAEAAAANSAQPRDTSIRASRYTGKTTDVIATTPIAFAIPYAVLASLTSQAGAVASSVRLSSEAGSPRRVRPSPSASERAICVYLSSSEKRYGVATSQACQA